MHHSLSRLNDQVIPRDISWACVCCSAPRSRMVDIWPGAKTKSAVDSVVGTYDSPCGAYIVDWFPLKSCARHLLACVSCACLSAVDWHVPCDFATASPTAQPCFYFIVVLQWCTTSAQAKARRRRRSNSNGCPETFPQRACRTSAHISWTARLEKKTDTHATSKRFIMLIYVDHSKQDIVLIQYVITMSHRDLLLRHQKRHKRWPKQLTKSYNAVLPSQNLRTDGW